MEVISVNVAQPSLVEINGKQVLTGIYKKPVSESVWLDALTLDGDDQADKKVHGGLDQAAYCYPHAHYAHWEHAFALPPLAHGAFGENFTTNGLSEDDVYIGDVLQIGNAIVQVTKPRIPCFKLAHKMGSPTFIKAFLKSGFSGFYVRVLTEGQVKAGDSISIINQDPKAISVRMALTLQKLDLQALGAEAAVLLRKALSIESLSQELETSYTKRLNMLEA